MAEFIRYEDTVNKIVVVMDLLPNGSFTFKDGAGQVIQQATFNDAATTPVKHVLIIETYPGTVTTTGLTAPAAPAGTASTCCKKVGGVCVQWC